MLKKIFKITVLTLFPDFISDYAKFGILQRAIKQKLISINSVQLRDFALDERGTVDDRPYGGGVGMVLKADVLIKAIMALKKQKGKKKKVKVILLTPQGKQFRQADAQRLSKYDHLIFISGRYEGFDERVRSFVDEELSVGDYVLMGGELPALVISEAVMRLIPGVLGKLESTDNESFSENLLEYPQYTKPEVLEIKEKGKSGKLKGKLLQVPKVLLTGHHKNVLDWRKAEALKRTKKRRPDLLK
jgi:tRNA (guanine37-N1)-methyltransferase